MNCCGEDAFEHRMHIQQQLLDLASSVIANRFDMPIVHEDKERSLIVHQRWEGNSPLTVLEVIADGVPPQKFINFFHNQHEIMPKYNKVVKVTKIDEDAGFMVVHQRWKMPFMLSNRSFFNTYYHIDGCEPGEYQFIVSGHGNEKYAIKHAACAGKDVIGEMNINYIGIRPARNYKGEIYGTFLQQVQSINPHGLIMEWMKSRIARK